MKRSLCTLFAALVAATALHADDGWKFVPWNEFVD